MPQPRYEAPSIRILFRLRREPELRLLLVVQLCWDFYCIHGFASDGLEPVPCQRRDLHKWRFPIAREDLFKQLVDDSVISVTLQ